MEKCSKYKNCTSFNLFALANWRTTSLFPWREKKNGTMALIQLDKHQCSDQYRGKIFSDDLLKTAIWISIHRSLDLRTKFTPNRKKKSLHSQMDAEMSRFFSRALLQKVMDASHFFFFFLSLEDHSSSCHLPDFLFQSILSFKFPSPRNDTNLLCSLLVQIPHWKFWWKKKSLESGLRWFYFSCKCNVHIWSDFPFILIDFHGNENRKEGKSGPTSNHRQWMISKTENSEFSLY